MNEVIIYFILLIIIFLTINKKDKNPTIYIKKNEVIPNKIIIVDDVQLVKNKTNTIYNPHKNKEQGGSKQFKDVIMDDNNLVINQVNYKNYESYRKKPIILKK